MAWIGPAIGAGASLLGAKKQSDAQKKAASVRPQDFLMPEQRQIYAPLYQAIMGQLQNPGQLSVADGGLTETEKAYRERLMGDLGSVPGLAQSVKDAMFRGITSRLDEDYRAQREAADRDLIRRGFGISSGEALNRMGALDKSRARAIAEAGNQVETYADQVARQEKGSLMDRLMGFAGYERGNQQAALDRLYGARDAAIRNAMGFAGINSGLAGMGYQGRLGALQDQATAYGNLGAWGAKQLQGVDWRRLLGLGGGTATQGFGDFRMAAG